MKTRLFLLLAAAAIVSALLYIYRDAWSLRPFETENVYVNISRVATDASGAVYTVTDSKETLQKVDAAGELVYAISSNASAETNSIQLYNSITADPEGNAYALVTTLDSYGLKVLGERIVRISPDGAKQSVIYKADYNASDHLLRVGKIQSLSVRDGDVYFFLKETESASLLRISGNDAVDGKPESVNTVTLPEDRYLSELTGNHDGQFFYTTKRGMLFAFKDGQVSRLYPEDGQNHLASPESITTKDHQNVYFINDHLHALQRLDSASPQTAAASLITLDELARQHPNIEWSDFTGLTVNNGMITVATSDRIVKLSPDGKVLSVSGSFHYPSSLIWARAGYWLLLLALVLLAGGMIRHIYVHVLKRRVSLLVKQLGVIVPVVLLSMIGLSFSVHSSFSKEMKNDTRQQLELLAANGKYLIEGTKLEGLNSPRDFMSADYKAIKTRINDLFSQTGEGRDGLYNTIYRYMDGKLYIMMDDDDSVTMFTPFPLSEENLLVLEQGAIVSGEWEDAGGQWMYALGPLYNSMGEIIGIYETGKDMKGVEKSNQRILSGVMVKIAFIGLLLLLVITLMTVYLLSSIRKLRRNVNLIASGEWNAKVRIRTRDEVADLGQRFNMMADSIRRYIQEVTKLSSAYFRFVPQPFLNVLGKQNMTQVQLGDQVNQPMTVLVCNMRDFTPFSAKLSTEENFRFINSFLKVFGPVIREHEGFISRYLGAGMLSLFPNHPREAVHSAIKLRAELESYNAGRMKGGYAPIDIGISLHVGHVMLGIIGEEERMEGSVVSNHVQLTLDLERASAKLGVSVLLTEETVRSCNDQLPGGYRKLGTFQLSEEQPPITLYDLFEGDAAEVKKLKAATKAQFEQAVELYQQGRFYDAREIFVSVVKKNRHDLAAKLYFFACDRLYQEGSAGDWNQALKIS